MLIQHFHKSFVSDYPDVREFNLIECLRPQHSDHVFGVERILWTETPTRLIFQGSDIKNLSIIFGEHALTLQFKMSECDVIRVVVVRRLCVWLQKVNIVLCLW